MHACQILPPILIDNLDCFKHTLNSNVDAYHRNRAEITVVVCEQKPCSV